MASLVTTDRESKARDLVRDHLANRDAGIIRARVNASGVNTWLVNGHVVTLEPVETCDCPDRLHRGTTCKHILAVRLLNAPTPAPAPVPGIAWSARPARTEWVEEV